MLNNAWSLSFLHVLSVAEHCFAVLDVFASGSDDRSADVFREKIESATQMKAVLGADPRPNCLIIDEIDGAPQVSCLFSLYNLDVIVT